MLPPRSKSSGWTAVVSSGPPRRAAEVEFAVVELAYLGKALAELSRSLRLQHTELQRERIDVAARRRLGLSMIFCTACGLQRAHFIQGGIARIGAVSARAKPIDAQPAAQCDGAPICSRAARTQVE
jgi:hypothetical protein